MGWFDYNDVGIDLGTASVLVTERKVITEC